VSTDFRDAYFVPSKVRNLVAPRPLDQHLFNGRPWQISDANWSADFPTSAAEYARFYFRETGTAVDGVLGLSTNTFSDILRLTGRVPVPGFRQIITPDGAMRQLSSIANKVNPGDPGKSYLVGFGHEMIERVRRLPANKLPDLGKALAKGQRQSDLLVWLRDPIAAALVPASLQGRVTTLAGSDQLLITDANLSGGKNDLFVTKSAALTVTPTTTGSTAHHLVLTYYQPQPHNAEERGLLTNSTRGYRDYIEVRVPAGASLTGMRLTDRTGSRQVGPEAIDTDHGLVRFGFFLLLPLGQKATVSFDYRTTTAFTSLTWTKQLQALPHAISLDVTWPDGRTVHLEKSFSSTVNVRR
jgi:hypothetical protein